VWIQLAGLGMVEFQVAWLILAAIQSDLQYFTNF
jgi:hypothetical protein